MRIATWNVNGLRARQAQLLEWVARDRPDVICLQEIKAAPEQIPAELVTLDGYWCYWHGHKGYSGVGLHLRKERFPEAPRFAHPAFDTETRVVTAEVGDLLVGSIYVPNGGKDYDAKLRFLDALDRWIAEVGAEARPFLLCGDLNVARTDRDIHPRERKPNQIGARPDERALLERVLERRLVDLGRTLHPDDDGLFTYWAPWRNLRQRNVGWRIDYILASAQLLPRVTSCVVQAEVGTSDHAPVVAEIVV